MLYESVLWYVGELAVFIVWITFPDEIEAGVVALLKYACQEGPEVFLPLPAQALF